MDRNAASRELNKVSGPGTLEFSWATPADDSEIRGVLGKIPMEGAVRLGFTREPSYFACPDPADTEERTLLARLDGRLVCLGSLSEREVWLAGCPTRVGYLGGLRMVPDVRGAPRILREGYARFHEQAARSPAELWFTSIAADNMRARKVLESHRLGLPHYSPIGDLETRVIPVRKRVSSSDGVEIPEDAAELDSFLNQEAERHPLALTWSPARWSALARDGFGLKQVRVVRRNGRIVAAAGVWDQSKWKQVRIHGYAPWMNRARTFYNFWSALRGYSGLPAAGQSLPMANVFPFAVAAGEESALPVLWSGVEELSCDARVGWIALGLESGDLLWSHLPKRSGARFYQTTLYQVTDAGARGLTGSLRPEIALL